MNETRIIKQLESDTCVLFKEWKEIAFLLYMTEDKPFKKVLKSKYQLQET